MKAHKITVLDSLPEDGKTPTKMYIINSLGQYVFIHKRSRADAQAVVDEIYGKGFFKVKTIQNAIVR